MKKKRFRDQLVEEIELRGLDDKTKVAYVASVKDLAEHYQGVPLSKLEIPALRAYQSYLIKLRKLAPNSVNRHMCGIRFFYREILGRNYDSELPRVKVPKKIPIILTEAEVASLIDSVHNVMYKVLIMLMYSAGLRNSEVRKLKVADIDKTRMLIHVDGKHARERQALLSPLVLKSLRTYWILFRYKKGNQSEYVFTPTKSPQGNLEKPISYTTLSYALKVAAKASGIKKKFALICSATAWELIY